MRFARIQPIVRYPWRCHAAASLWLSLALALGLAATDVPASSKPRRVHFILSSASDLHKHFFEHTTQRLRNTPALTFDVETLPDADPADVDPRGDIATADLIVTVGTRAALHATKRDSDTPRLFTLVTAEVYQTQLRPVVTTTHGVRFVDYPARYYLQLAAHALPQRQRVGLVLGPSSQRHRDKLTVAAEALSLSLQIESATDYRELGAMTRAVLGAADTYVALPDPLVHNAYTARNLLLTAFRQRVPVIGYSAAFVRAGAVAALHADPERLAAETADTISNFLTEGGTALSGTGVPRHVSVSVNSLVATRLGLAQLRATELERRLTAQLGSPL